MYNQKESYNEHNMLIKEYDILVELIKHQHTRVQDFDKTFLTANALIVTASISFLKGNDLIFLCLSGFAVSLIWICVSQRMAIDSKLRWFQLRSKEKALSRLNGIFTDGYKFFYNKETLQFPDEKESLDFPKGTIFKFRVIWTGFSLPFVFIIFYIVLLFLRFKI